MKKYVNQQVKNLLGIKKHSKFAQLKINRYICPSKIQ